MSHPGRCALPVGTRARLGLSLAQWWRPEILREDPQRLGPCLCREVSLVFLFTPGDYPERIVAKRPLKPERFLRRRTHP
jgi:hypothetical protein